VEAGWKGAKNLLVVADGALGQLPFSVLVTEADQAGPEQKPLFSNYRDVSFLARSHAVTMLPSVSALGILRSLPPASPARRNFVGFGDPLFSAQQARAAALPGPGTQTAALTSRGLLQVRGLPVNLRSAPKLDNVSSADLARLPRLPDTADEVKSIAVAMNADLTRDVFTGKQASEGTVKTAKLSGYKVVAFATHGLVPGDLDGLTQPALALSSPKVTGGKEDGLLTMGEVLGLELDADWVVLSACNTASGDGAGAEAVSGLGRAFFYAGTRALLVSNWPVETTSARALTTDIFRRQVGDTAISRAEALRQSMLALIDGPGFKDAQGRTVFSYAHPIFWAPFSLVGDGGGGGKPAS
jgi:CHAT domain-containing protein